MCSGATKKLFLFKLNVIVIRLGVTPPDPTKMDLSIYFSCVVLVGPGLIVFLGKNGQEA